MDMTQPKLNFMYLELVFLGLEGRGGAIQKHKRYWIHLILLKLTNTMTR